MYLLDTNAIRDLIDENPRVADRLAQASADEPVSMPVIVHGELLFGLQRMPAGRRRDALVHKAALVVASLLVQEVPAPAGDHYAGIKRMSEVRGKPMGENDLWIAATALTLGATLVTRDTAFTNLPGLRIEDWTT
jgi:tRNA(fMet)-specific endonuclease VapC